MLRNRRDVGWPNVADIAKIVLDAGAVGITIHPRPDQRHIRFDDVNILRDLLRSDYPKAEYNIEGYPSEEFLLLAEKAMPDQVTFVPDDPAQSTSDHGWDINANKEMLEKNIKRMKAFNIRVALFIDEDPTIPADAREVGADRVELYTGPYGANFATSNGDYHLQRLGVTARAAHAAGLKVNAGHDLTLDNLPAFLQAVPNVAEVSIGHGITADALVMGFERAVKAYINVLEKASQ